MPRPLLRNLFMLFSLAMMLLVQPVPPSLAASAGREFSRCVQGCNEARKACDTRCKTECAEMFPSSKKQRDACIAACKDICVAESGDCKQVCLQNKNGHAEEP